MPKKKDYGFGDPFEYARNASMGDGERFSMPEKAKDTGISKPVKREYVEFTKKAAPESAKPAPAPLTSESTPKVETKKVTSAPAPKKQNFSSPPPTPKPRPSMSASTDSGRRWNTGSYNASDAEMDKTSKELSNAPAPKSSGYKPNAINRATDWAVDNVLPFAIGPTGRVAGAVGKAVGNAARKALPSPSKALPSPKSNPKKLQDSTSGPTINLGAPKKTPKPKSEPLNAGVKRTISRGTKGLSGISKAAGKKKKK